MEIVNKMSEPWSSSLMQISKIYPASLSGVGPVVRHISYFLNVIPFNLGRRLAVLTEFSVSFAGLCLK